MLGNKRRKSTRHKECQEKRKSKKLEPAGEDDDSFCEIITPDGERIGEEQEEEESEITWPGKQEIGALKGKYLMHPSRKSDGKSAAWYLAARTLTREVIVTGKWLGLNCEDMDT